MQPTDYGPAPPSAPPGRDATIRVLLVDDSSLALEVMQRMLAAVPGILVVGTAADGARALERVASLHPDVVCTDVHMPGMDGLEFVERLMASHPTPVLVVSVSVQPEDTEKIFTLLEAGAVDVMAKPRGGTAEAFSRHAADFAHKIRVVAGVHVFQRHRRTSPSPLPLTRPPPPAVRPRIVAVAASTGGPQALLGVLAPLPASFPLPLVCVQHIASGFLAGLVAWLAHACRIRVCIARSGERPLAGTAYFAPEGLHLELGGRGELVCSDAPPCHGHRPSASLTLLSVAHHHGAAAVGIVLSGMGEDGVEGLRAIAAAGGLTYAQDEASCAVFGMPRAAIESGAARFVLAPEAIAAALVAHVAMTAS